MEEKRNQLNLEIRSLLSVVDMIIGENKNYPNYKTGTLSEEDYLKQQIELVKEAREKLVNIFK